MSTIRNSAPQGFLRRLLNGISPESTGNEPPPTTSNSLGCNTLGHMARQTRSIDRFEMISSPSDKKNSENQVPDNHLVAYLDQVK
ncbi:MAG: hypothetical protein Q7S98_06965 [Deltaproteobacteria bacterium]|nr:hypothetical protein [Deltaproteobacteria bacterium]